MRRGINSVAAIIMIAIGGWSMASGAVTPPVGSPDRAQIMDAIRPPVEKELKGPLKFRVIQLNVVDGYGFAMLAPQYPNGTLVNPKDAALVGTRFADKDWQAIAGSLEVTAILKKQGAQWQLVRYEIGATDVWYEEYCNKIHGLCS